MAGIKGFKQLTPNTLVEDLIKFVTNELPSFVSSHEFKAILAKKKNENQHSTAFCVFMTNTCSSKYCFQRENAQRGSSVIDIGVYFGSNLIFTIEAKLLPTPPGSKTKPRNEHEYVYGDGAGIERFKNEKHGYDNSDKPLRENAMIGYITNESFGYWLEKVNQWIIDAKWDTSEKLIKQSFDKIAKLRSEHQRKNSSKITLHHFWVKVA